MSLYFLGDTHAAQHMRMAASVRGNEIASDIRDAHVIFVCDDTPTDENGKRDTSHIRRDLLRAIDSRVRFLADIVLTSQVEPGFTRQLPVGNLFHQAETLRIKDAFHRAIAPDYIIVGGKDCPNPSYAKYLLSFGCPIIFGTWEDAEFSKIAVNMMLAAQVDRTNMLAEAAAKVGANWEKVCEALRADKRIGPEAYLTPGHWQDSSHLLRDWVTLEEIRSRKSSSDE